MTRENIRWAKAIAGLIVIFLGHDLHFLNPNLNAVVGAACTGIGVALIQKGLQRSMARNFARLVCAFLLIHLGLFLFLRPGIWNLALWPLLGALALGAADTALPLSTRRRGFGLALASEWAVLVSTVLRMWPEIGGQMIASVVGSLLLVGPTLVYNRWAKHRMLPAPIVNGYWALPEDEAPAITTTSRS